MAATCESGNVERADNVLADGTLGKPLYEGMPALGKGLGADVVEFVPDVVATGQHTTQDEGGRDGRVIATKDVFTAGHVGNTVFHVCKYHLNTLE